MGGDDLFAERSSANKAGAFHEPLAARMRPTTIDQFAGQGDILRETSPLSRFFRSGPRQTLPSLILWGPPGTGKTTLARLVVNHADAELVQLSAINAGVKDVRSAIEKATINRELYQRASVLFIDEIHRFSTTQQDALLPAVEHGHVSLIGATTENPSFCLVPALLSRCLLVPLSRLSDAAINGLVDRALQAPEGLNGTYDVDALASSAIVQLAGGDARRALTILEAAAAGAAADDSARIDRSHVEAAAAHAVPRYDRRGDAHYDVISAFIKSIRGSDPDAALHYLARMLVAGEDPRFIARRLIIAASEDVGLADSTGLSVAVAALHAVSHIGMPEARITLAHATVHLATAPKSNSVYRAVDMAIADVHSGHIGDVPGPLRDASASASRSTGAGKGYVYPHDEPSGVAAGNYRPAGLEDAVYYVPTHRGSEREIAQNYDRIRQIVGLPDLPRP